MSETMIETCKECRESENAIWINCEWLEDSQSDFLCERCYDKLAVRSGNTNVQGSQWDGEE